MDDIQLEVGQQVGRGLPTVYLALGGVVVAMVLAAIFGKIPIGYNFRNLAIRWKTTVMTSVAFAVVIALLVVMVAFVNGMVRVTEQSGRADNVIVLSDGATDEQFSNLGYNDSSDIALHPLVKRDGENRPMCSREVYVVVGQALTKPRGGQTRRFVQVRGLEDPAVAIAVHDVKLDAGSVFSPAGVVALPDKASEQAIEAILGAGIAREMAIDQGKERINVGDLFELGGRKWIVAGIMSQSGSTFGSEIWAKSSLVGPLFGKETFSSIICQSKDAASATELAADLTANYKKAAVQAQTERKYYASLSSTNQQFLFAIIFVTIFLAIGGVFGVMNTMFAAISQRVKDIGVLRVLGFARWQILVSFLLESLLIAFVGGIIGCALGSLAHGWTASSIVSGGPGGPGKFVVLTLVVTASTVASGLLLSLAMGFIGGLVPAVLAMRFRPLEALQGQR